MTADNKDNIYAIRLMRGYSISKLSGSPSSTERGPFERCNAGVGIVIGMINGNKRACNMVGHQSLSIGYKNEEIIDEQIIIRQESEEFCRLMSQAATEIIDRKYKGLECMNTLVTIRKLCGGYGLYKDNHTIRVNYKDCHISLQLHGPYIRWMREIYNRLIDDIQNVYFCIDRGYNFEESELNVTISKQAEEIRALKKNIVELMRENEKNRAKSEKYDAMIGVFSDIGAVFRGRVG